MTSLEYAPVEALLYAKQFVKSAPIERVGVDILNNALFEFWAAAPWRWTLGSFPDFTLEAGVSEYCIDYPFDFSYAYQCSLSEGSKIPRPVEIVAAIPQTVNLTGQPSKIAFMSQAGACPGIVRISPKQYTVSSSPTFITVYKKKTPRLKAYNMNQRCLPFGDTWFYIFKELVLYHALKYSFDQRAGEVSFDAAGNKKCNGQRAVYESALYDMKQREKLQDLDVREAQDRKGVA